MPVKFLFLAFFAGFALLGQSTQEDRDRELEQLKQKILYLQQQLEKSEAQKRSVSEQLKAVKLRRELLEQELRSLDLQMHQKSVQLDSLSETLEELSGEVKTEKEFLLAKLRFLNHMGSLGYVRLFFLSDADGDIVSSLRWIIHLAQQDRQLIDTYMDNMQDLQRKKELADELHRTLADFRKEKEEKKKKLNRAIREHRYLLTKIQREEKETREQVAQLEEKARRLQRLLDILTTVSTTQLAKEDIHRFRGVLDWPLKGEITSRFGYIVNPAYGTKVDMKGIQISIEKTQEVSPIFPGQVVYASWFKGYRNLVIVDHGFGVVSIYGYLDSLAAKKGQWIYPGKMLGKVIAGGSTEPKLYLEIRDGGASVDPLGWLR